MGSVTNWPGDVRPLGCCDWGSCTAPPVAIVEYSTRAGSGHWVTGERRPMCATHVDMDRETCASWRVSAPGMSWRAWPLEVLT